MYLFISLFRCALSYFSFSLHHLPFHVLCTIQHRNSPLRAAVTSRHDSAYDSNDNNATTEDSNETKNNDDSKSKKAARFRHHNYRSQHDDDDSDDDDDDDDDRGNEDKSPNNSSSDDETKNDRFGVFMFEQDEEDANPPDASSPEPISLALTIDRMYMSTDNTVKTGKRINTLSKSAPLLVSN